MIPVIMSGGSGTRLWPLSRKDRPKQFLSLLGEQSLFQQTIIRLAGILDITSPVIVCNEAYRFVVAQQLHEIGISNADIMLEPCARNTAPALAVAAIQAKQSSHDPVLLVLAADHVIKDIDGFHQAIKEARIQAEQGYIATFGIVPTEAHTGYGYIKATQKNIISKVALFVEKPDKRLAQQYIASGEYYWNSGMFMCKASTILRELAIHAPQISTSCQKAVSGAASDLDFIRLDKDSFTACPADSIDYAVMENTDKAIVVPLDAGWDDVGSWTSLSAVHRADDDNNVTIGDVCMRYVRDSYIHSNSRLVVALGVSNTIVVETPDAVLVTDKDHADKVKVIVEQLITDGRTEALTHRKCYRPWGCYDLIDSGSRFQVKRITVNPGAALSLQKHFHRAEHWVVVKGTAEVICDDNVMTLKTNESTFIPLGSVHRLRNLGDGLLEIIEVQSGSYLGEDDIVRLDDNYNRN